jgi:hypothetical protein
MPIAEAGIEHLMWVYLSVVRRVDREARFIDHPIGTREVAGLALTSPGCRFVRCQQLAQHHFGSQVHLPAAAGERRDRAT